MTKVRQWTLLTALGCVAVLVAGWFLLISGQRSQAKQVKAQTQAQLVQNEQLQNQLQSLINENRNLPAEQAKLAELGVKIPGTPELPALIRELSSAADSAGVDLRSLSPQTPSLVTAQTPTASTGRPAVPSSTLGGAATTGAIPAPQLAQISVQMQVVGTFYNVEQFFANIENLTRALRVSTFSLASCSGGGGGGSCADRNAPQSSTANANAAAASLPVGASPLLSGTITAQVYMAANATTGQ